MGGSYNIVLGYSAGSSFNANESNNIDIGNLGVNGEANVIRIGDTNAQDGCRTLPCQTATYIAGINGASPPSPLPVVIGSNGQLGTGAFAVGTVTSVASGTGLTGDPSPRVERSAWIPALSPPMPAPRARSRAA